MRYQEFLISYLYIKTSKKLEICFLWGMQFMMNYLEFFSKDIRYGRSQNRKVLARIAIKEKSHPRRGCLLDRLSKQKCLSLGNRHLLATG